MEMIAQGIMVLTLLLMVVGKTPIYSTAIVGSVITAMVAGIPFAGGADTTITKLINGGLNPVIADMAGVLMFIGVMEKAGFLDVIIKGIMKFGRMVGGGPGVAAAGGIAAGVIGMLTGFTQPAITAVVTGPASLKLGVDKDKSAGIHSHAGTLGNFGGFTHPTQVTVVATTGIGFGLINVIGVLTGLSLFLFSFIRLKKEERQKNFQLSKDELAKIIKEFETKDEKVSLSTALIPFIVLFTGFVLGFPVFVVGLLSGLLCIALAKMSPAEGEKQMLDGVGRISTPLIATIGFLFMSGVLRAVGLADIIGTIFNPLLSVAPVQTLLLVSAFAGLITQSNGASIAITLPFLQAVLGMGADPFASACAAAGGSAIMQYFLTGGPVAALATVIPVIPGSELKAANKFQRPSILMALAFLFVLTFIL